MQNIVEGLFGDDEDDFECNPMVEIAQQVSVWLLTHDAKPRLKRSSIPYWEEDVVASYIHRKAGIDILHDADELNYAEIARKLQSDGFQLSDLKTGSFVDVIVAIASSTELLHQNLVSSNVSHEQLFPGGLLLFILPSTSNDDHTQSFIDERKWILEATEHRSNYLCILLRKRAVSINETGAIYWTSNPSRLPHERSLVHTITTSLTTAEQEEQVFTAQTHRKIVETLRTYGICIIANLYSADRLHAHKQAALDDMQSIINTLQQAHDIDLLQVDPVKAEQQKLENYRELSMREARRVDIRSTLCLSSLDPTAHIWPSLPATTASSEGMLPAKEAGTLPASAALSQHPGLLSTLHQVLCPNYPSIESSGNWGRWNFDGTGPETPTPIVIGRPGCVMSFPGCVDQTIHADTAHLFDVQLPPHYINLFLPVSSSLDFHTRQGELEGYSIGQTAFVIGSHELKVSAEIMAKQNESELLTRLIRPQLQPGDALLFDCRILHFGLANQYVSSSGKEEAEQVQNQQQWRPLLYVNYHRDWFEDPKNWDNRRSVFDNKNINRIVVK